MATIGLPQAPDGEQYHDLITAGLTALGYFTESRLVLRDEGKEVLELDVVATPAGAESGQRCLYEAKATKEGIRFPNIFKLFGQRTYLNLASACLVSLEATEKLDVYERHAGEMGVRICHFPLDLEQLHTLAAPNNDISVGTRHRIAAAAWYQQIARRQALADFNRANKVRRGLPIQEALRQYVFRVREAFFQPTALQRAEALYRAYFDNPKVIGQVVEQLAQERGVSTVPIWNPLNDNTGDLLWLQYAMAVENTARIAIIKNALDDVVERGAVPLPSQKVVFTVGGKPVEMTWPLHDLPNSFKKGLDAVRTHPRGLRIPFLFQVTIELFGGILAVNNEAEMALLGQVTGFPPDEIPEALKLFDQFFAPSGGGSFFYTQGKGELTCMKLVPGFMRGGGAFLRFLALDVEDYRRTYPEMGWLWEHLHNRLVALLEPTLRKV